MADVNLFQFFFCMHDLFLLYCCSGKVWNHVSALFFLELISCVCACVKHDGMMVSLVHDLFVISLVVCLVSACSWCNL